MTVKAGVIPQEVDLKWEFLGGDGWEAFTPLGDNQDDKDTVRLRNEGSHSIVFSSNQQNAGADVRCVLSEISGKKSYWIRARIVNGTNASVFTSTAVRGSSAQPVMVHRWS